MKLDKNSLKKLRVADLLSEVPEAVIVTKEGITFLDENLELVTLKLNKTEYEDTRLVLINFDGL
jgi:hypothetical protein